VDRRELEHDASAYQLQLFLIPDRPAQYGGMSSSPGAASWPTTIDCPPDEGGSSTLPIAVPIWFLTGLQQWDDPTFSMIKGNTAATATPSPGASRASGSEGKVEMYSGDDFRASEACGHIPIAGVIYACTPNVCE
jgi:hypothetical protein